MEFKFKIRFKDSTDSREVLYTCDTWRQKSRGGTSEPQNLLTSEQLDDTCDTWIFRGSRISGGFIYIMCGARGMCF